MRLDNVHPKVTFEGDKARIKFKYPPTQEEFDAGMAWLAEGMEYANKMTGQDIHIIGWDKEKES